MLQIGYNKEQEASYNNVVESKKNAFTNLLDHVKQFIQLDEIDFNSEDLNNEISSKVLANYRSEFPSIVTDAKILDLIGFEYHKLQSLTERFKNIQVDFDVISQECPKVDFGIYTRNKDQVNKWFDLVHLSDEINKNIDSVSVGLIPRHQLCALLGNTIIYDHTEQRFKPNVTYILSI